jgi:hypothetical protein
VRLGGRWSWEEWTAWARLQVRVAVVVDRLDGMEKVGSKGGSCWLPWTNRDVDRLESDATCCSCSSSFF